MRALRLLAAALFVLIYTGTALAQASAPVVFGSTRVVRAHGRPDTFERTFIVPPWVVGPFTLRVQNGDPDGSSRQVLGWIWINGRRVVGPSDFRRNRNRRFDDEHERTSFPDRDDDDDDEQAERKRGRPPSDGVVVREVTLQDTNTLRIRLSGRRGRYITVSITGTSGDRTAPQLTLLEPAAASVNTPAVRVRWRYGDSVGAGERGASGVAPSTVGLSVDGIDRTSSFAVTATEASASLGLGEGRHAFQAHVSDVAGNVRTADASVYVDSIPPALSFTSPSPGTYLTGPAVNVTGVVSDASTVQITLNGVPATISGTSFSGTVTAPDGPLTVHAVARDGANNVVAEDLSVTLDTVPPSVVVMEPAAGLITGQRSVHLTGTVSESSPFTVRVNGADLAVTSGRFAADVNLPSEGANALLLFAQDLAGNATTVDVSVTADRTPPHLAIVSPGEGAVVTKLPFTVQGRVVDLTSVSVAVNGASADVAGGEWSASINALPDGAGTVTVMATDAAGNRTTLTQPFVLDTTPPVVTVLEPMPETSTDAGEVTVSGTVDDVTLQSLVVNGIPATLAGSGVSRTFQAKVPVAEGDNLIVVAATDATGRSGEAQVHVTKVTVVPCSYAVSPSSAASPAGGGNGALTVSTISGCLWTASATTPWISVAAISAGYRGQIVADAPVGYWRLGDMDGPIARADSGHGVDGAISGSVTHGLTGATSDGDTATRFQSAYMEFAGGVPVPAGAFTIEAWVQDGWSGTLAFTSRWRLTIEGGYVQFYAERNESPVFDVRTEQPLDDGLWHHLVAVYDPARNAAQLFVDGVLDASGPTAGKPLQGSAIFLIGPLTATLDEVAVYPSALTPEQVARHFDQRTSPGGGAGTVTYTVAPNPSFQPRSGIVNVAGFATPIAQAGQNCFTLTPATLAPATGGASGTIHIAVVDGGCAWTASSAAAWVTVDLSAGTGTGDVHYTVAANPTPLDRSAALNIAGQAVSVSQSGVPVQRPGSHYAVAAGVQHSLALKDDGSVWSWGTNTKGQLGDGTVLLRGVPVQVSSLANVVAIAAGDAHSLALESDGTVWAWGTNAFGQIAGGGLAFRAVPGQVSGLSNIVAIAAGSEHSLALKADGTVWAWGRNDLGQLGDGTDSHRSVPTRVTGLAARATAVAAAGARTFVVDAPGQLWGFGFGTVAPTQVALTTPVMTPVASASGWFAVGPDGAIWALGVNDRGQLGDGTTISPAAAVQLSVTGDVSQLSAGQWHTLALRTGGTVDAWGGNDASQLGDGTPPCPSGSDFLCPRRQYSAAPIHVPGPVSVVGVAANGNGSTSLAVSSDGRVWTWGRNDARQLGDGTIVSSPLPLQIADAGFVWHTGTPILTSGGVFTFEKSATAASATPGAVIHYTLNGADPTESDPIMPAAPSGIAITHTTTLKARAWAAGKPPSGIGLETYTLKPLMPVVSPGGGTYTASQVVSLTTATSAATIRYSLDGTDPTAASPAYVSPISIGTATVLKAAAFRSGWTPSDVVSATYAFDIVTPPPPPPAVPSPGPCTYYLAPGAVAAPAQATTGELTVTTSDESCGWSVVADVPWLSVDTTGHMSAYAQVVSADDPVGYWRLNDPVGAAIASDISGFGRTAAVSGGVTFGHAGPLADGSTAASFDGRTGAIEIRHDAGLSLTALTWEAWINVPSVSSEWRWILGEGDSNEVFSLWIAPGSQRATLYYGVAGVGRQQVSLPSTLVGAGWVHLAFAISETAWHAYVNGVEDNTGPGGGVLAASAGPILFGRDYAGDSWYDSLLAEMALYPYALSAWQIADHASQRGVMVRGGGRVTYVVEANLTAASRSATMTVAGAAVPVRQAAIGGIAIAGGASTLAARGWTNAGVTVSFVCAGDGAIACPSPVTLFRDGEYDVPGQAVNDLGGTASTTVHVGIDKSAPYVSVSSPALHQLVGAGELAVRGTTIDLVSGLTGVMCNDVPATITDTAFLCNVTIASGASTITLRAFDAASNMRVATVSVITEDAVSSSPPASLRVTPQNTTMLAGETRRFSVLDNFDRIPSDAEWTIDNATVAVVSTAPDVRLTGVSAGTVTLTATWQGLSAATRVTVVGAATAPVGTTLWSAPPVQGSIERIVQGAVTFDNERRVYALEHDDRVQGDLIRAFDVDGREVWASSVGGRVMQLSGDPFGGVVALSGGPFGGTITGFTAEGSGFAVGTDTGPGFAIDADGVVYYVKQGAVLMAGSGALPLPDPNGSGAILAGIPTVLEDGSVALPISEAFSSRVQLVIKAPDGGSTIHTVYESPAGSPDFAIPFKAVPNGHGDILVAWDAAHGSLGSANHPFSAYVGVVRGDGQTNEYLSEVGDTWGTPGTKPSRPYGDLVVMEDRVVTTAYRLDGDLNDAVASRLTLTGAIVSGDSWRAPEGQAPQFPTFLAAAGGGFIVSYPDGTMGGTDPAFGEMHLAKAQYQGAGNWIGATNSALTTIVGPQVSEANSVWSGMQGGGLFANLAQKPGRGIFAKGHSIVLGLAGHVSLRIVPKNQEKWLQRRPDLFSYYNPLGGTVIPNYDAFSNRFFTIGAGPDSPPGVDFECTSNPRMVSAPNRDKDVHQAPQPGWLERLQYSSLLEDAYISRLLELDDNYGDDLRYECIPDPGTDEFNSNSYAAGLIGAAWLIRPKFPTRDSWYFPGWTKPVPADKFQAH